MFELKVQRKAVKALFKLLVWRIYPEKKFNDVKKSTFSLSKDGIEIYRLTNTCNIDKDCILIISYIMKDWRQADEYARMFL